MFCAGMVRATAFRLSVQKPRRRQTAIRGRALACSQATTATVSRQLQSAAAAKSLLPTALCSCPLIRRAPETSPCQVQSKQGGELDPSLGPPPRHSLSGQEVEYCEGRSGKQGFRRGPAGSERRPGFAASRAAQVGGDGGHHASAQLGVGAAPGQPRQNFYACESSGHGAGANPSVRGRALGAGESNGIKSHNKTHKMRSLVAPQFGVQLPTPGRGWFTMYRAWTSPVPIQDRRAGGRRVPQPSPRQALHSSLSGDSGWASSPACFSS
jgi:hypothetical protein